MHMCQMLSCNAITVEPHIFAGNKTVDSQLASVRIKKCDKEKDLFDLNRMIRIKLKIGRMKRAAVRIQIKFECVKIDEIVFEIGRLRHTLISELIEMSKYEMVLRRSIHTIKYMGQ